MSLEVYSRQSKAFQYDGYKINSEMREHINAEKSSSVNSNPRIPFVTQDSLFVNENPVL